MALLLGIKRFSKSLWKSFKLDLGDIEESLSAAKSEIREELQLASEKATRSFRRLLTAEIEENRIHRLQLAADIQENKDFLTQQTLALRYAQDREIQKILRNEGTSSKCEKRY
jgi:hypothetical protein